MIYGNEHKMEIFTTGGVSKTPNLKQKWKRTGANFYARNSLQHCSYSTKEF